MKVVAHTKTGRSINNTDMQLNAKNGTATLDVIQERVNIFTVTVQYYWI